MHVRKNESEIEALKRIPVSEFVRKYVRQLENKSVYFSTCLSVYRLHFTRTFCMGCVIMHRGRRDAATAIRKYTLLGNCKKYSPSFVIFAMYTYRGGNVSRTRSIFLNLVFSRRLILIGILCWLLSDGKLFVRNNPTRFINIQTRVRVRGF